MAEMRVGPAPLQPYPDARILLVDLLSTLAKAGIETPKAWKGNLPFIQVSDIGGSEFNWTDRQRIDIYVYYDNVPGAARQGRLLAERVRQYLQATPHYIDNGDSIDLVRVFNSPAEVTSVNDSVRRWFASYEVHVSRTARITP